MRKPRAFWKQVLLAASCSAGLQILLILLTPVVIMLAVGAYFVFPPSRVTIDNAESLYRDTETLMPNPNVSGVRPEAWPPAIRALHPMLVGKDEPHTIFILINESGAFGTPHGYLISDDPADLKKIVAEGKDVGMRVIPSNHPHIFAYSCVDPNR